jgi:hypothetical protein
MNHKYFYSREYLRQNLSQSVLKRINTPHKQRLLDVALGATDDQICGATEFYKGLSRRSDSMAKYLDIDKATVAAMLAVLHNTKHGWDVTFSNLEKLVTRAIRMGDDVNLTGGVTNRQVRTALDCYRNVKSDTDIDKVVTDQNRRSLAHCIMYDLDRRPLVITQNIYDVWSGGDAATTTITGSLYARVANDTTFVALSLGIQPCELQALLDIVPSECLKLAY